MGSKKGRQFGKGSAFSEFMIAKVILLLGVGGLGSDLLINFLRMGVKKIFMLDYDTVADHNLNRQNMYCM